MVVGQPRVVRRCAGAAADEEDQDGRRCGERGTGGEGDVVGVDGSLRLLYRAGAVADHVIGDEVVKMVLRSAVPSDPPTCWVEFTMALATPAS